MLVVLGATGKTGRRLCARLLEAGEQVLALGRDEARLGALDTLGARTASVDVEDLHGLREAFSRAAAVYLMSPTGPRVEDVFEAHRQMGELAVEYGLEGRPSVDRVFEQNLIGTAQGVAEQLDALREPGIDHHILMYFAVSSADGLLDQLRWFGEAVLPLLDWRAPPAVAQLDRDRGRGAVS